jgi:hypothetical protein
MTAWQRSPRTGRLLRRVLMTLALVGVACLVVWGFVEGRGEAAKETERERPVEAASRIGEMDGHPVVKLDAQTLKGSGIEVAALSQAPYQTQLRGYGTVLDLTQLTDLSNSYANARAQLQVAQARLAASKMSLDRARSLYRNQQNVSLAQFQAADATAQADQATLAAADSQARTLAATALQSLGPVVGKALLDGLPLATQLVEQRSFLLQVTLPFGVTVPVPPPVATVQVEGSPLSPISFVSNATRTDPRLQGTSLLYLASASSGVLPGMNVLVSLPSGPQGDGLAVPPSAIVWWQDRAWIYRQAGPDNFVRTQVPTELPAGNGGYIVRNLPNDARIVTRGAQLLLSEEFRAQIQVGGD